MIQEVKELAPNLQTESLVDFCRLIDAEVNGISTGAIEVSARQHILRKWAEVRDAGDRVDIGTVEAGTKIKVVESVRGAAGVWYGRSSFRMGGCLDRAHAGRKGVCAIEKGKWEATTDRDNGRSSPSVQESLRSASHIPSERNVPGARKYEAVTQVEVGIAFVNFRIERIQEPEIRIVVGLAKG